MLYDPWPILPACRETQTLSGMGAHLKIQNSHGLTVGRKQGRGFLDCFKMQVKEHQPPGMLSVVLLPDLGAKLRLESGFEKEKKFRSNSGT